MPSRILRDSITTSDTLARLTAEEERLFLRLTVAVDDFGRFDARPAVLAARCFTVMAARIALEDVSRWLEGLVREGLVEIYHVHGRAFLHLTTWYLHQRPPRARKSKYPPPEDGDRRPRPGPEEAECGDMFASARRSQADVARESGIGSRESRSENRETVGDADVPLAEPKPKSDHTRFVAAFDSLYRETYGVGHTWGKKQGGMVQGLLRAHPLEKCLLHAENMYRRTPEWLARGGGALDLGTFVAHFDKLATATGPPRTGIARNGERILSPREIAARAAEAEDHEEPGALDP